jgi:hypothetical protein
MRAARAWAGLIAVLLLTTAPLGAQSAIPIAAPSRADSLLALGRLAMAEEELYAAVGSRLPLRAAIYRWPSSPIAACACSTASSAARMP